MTSFDTRVPRVAHVKRVTPDLMVTIDAFGDKDLFGPCVLACSRWVSSGPGSPCQEQLPVVGERVLALFPDNDVDHPWLLQETVGP